MKARPALPAALLAGTAELVGGFSIAAGLLTPIGTILITAVMTTAIVTVHFRNGIWNADGGFEFNVTLVACAYVVSALGPGSHPLENAFDIGNRAASIGRRARRPVDPGSTSTAPSRTSASRRSSTTSTLLTNRSGRRPL